MNSQFAIQKRIKKDQELVLEQLKKMPVVQAVCEKTSIGRTTYYRWRNENKEFAKLADEAIVDGTLLMNDFVESQLLSAIRDKNMTGIIFWLRSHHPAYANKVELTTNLRKQDENLTPEQEELIKKALEALKPDDGKKIANKTKEE